MTPKYIASILICFLSLEFAFCDNLSQESIPRKIRALETAASRIGCQKYIGHGYKYEHMYPLNGIFFDNTLMTVTNGQLTNFEMHIAIKADKDGIILLSPTANPGGSDLVFEIGVGIARNQYTVLRITKDSSDEVARVYTPNILSTARYTPFYITISDGTFNFGKEGNTPLITYIDKRLKSVKYFDVSSWGTDYGNFLFDCPRSPVIQKV